MSHFSQISGNVSLTLSSLQWEFVIENHIEKYFTTEIQFIQIIIQTLPSWRTCRGMVSQPLYSSYSLSLNMYCCSQRSTRFPLFIIISNFTDNSTPIVDLHLPLYIHSSTSRNTRAFTPLIHLWTTLLLRCNLVSLCRRQRRRSPHHPFIHSIPPLPRPQDAYQSYHLRLYLGPLRYSPHRQLIPR